MTNEVEIADSSVDRRLQITEDAKLFAVLSHATMGLVGLLVMFGAFESARGNKFAGKHAVTSVINGVILVLTLVVWYLIYLAVGQFTGPQNVYFVYQYVMMGLIVMFYATAFWSAIRASKGGYANIFWITPIIGRIYRD
jgi:CDP-diglyceride synthetase